MKPLPVPRTLARARTQTRTLDLHRGSTFSAMPISASSHGLAWERRRLIRDAFDREGYTAVLVTTAAGDVADTHNIPLRALNAATGEPVADDWVCRAFNRGFHREVAAGLGRQHIVFMLAYAGAAPMLIDSRSQTFTPLVGYTVELLNPAETERALNLAPDAIGSFNRDGSPRLVGGYRLVEEGGATKAVYRADEGKLLLPQLPHPEDVRRVQPLVAQIGMSIDIMHDKRFAVRTLLRNGGMPAGFLMLKSQGMTNREKEAFSRATNAKLTSPERRGRWVAMSADEVQPVPLDQGRTAPGTGWNDFSDAERAVIQSCIGVPDARLPGYVGGKTFENQATELRQWYGSGIRQYLAPIEDALNLWAANQANGVVYQFDTSDHPALQEDRSDRFERAIAGWDAGVLDLFETRHEMGLPAEEAHRGVFKADLEVAKAGALSDLATPLAKDEPPEGAAEDPALAENALEPANNDDGDRSTGPATRAVERAEPFVETADQRAYADTVAAGIAAAAAVLAEFAADYHRRIHKTTEGALRRLAGTNPTAADVFSVAARDKELRQDLPAVFAAMLAALVATYRQAAAHLDETAAAALTAQLADAEARFASDATRRIATLIDGTPDHPGWNQAIAADLAEAIAESRAAAETDEQLLERVRIVFGVEGSDVRATRIGEFEAGALEAAVAAGVLAGLKPGARKVWITRQDERVRSTHAELHGTEVAEGDDFIVGGHPAERPRDPSLPLGERASCRCVAYPS